MPVAIPHTQSSHQSVKPALSAGQHEPVASLIQPYSAFPKKLTGRTVWKREEFLTDTTAWKKRWTSAQISLLDEAYAQFEATGKQITEISRVSYGTFLADLQETFPLPPAIHSFLSDIRDSVVHGPGFTLIQGLPVNEWPIQKSAAIYLAIGTVFGWTLSQNGKGHVLGHVKDIGNDPTQIDKVRIYS
jgi:hypothetical protein